MKTKVLDFLKNPSENPMEDFNTGFGLLQKTPEISQMSIRNYNVQGYTPQSLENIKYDLKKAYEITDLDIHNHVIEVPEEKNVIVAGPAYDENLFVAANKDLYDNLLREMNDTEKQGFKLIDQYPFLKDETCPAELKALAWDSVSAFHAFKDAHTELFEKVVQPKDTELSLDEIYDIAAKLLDDFEINREIHAELEHFAKTGEILAEHELFADIKKNRELDALTSEELSKRINNLKSYISKIPGRIEKAKTPEAIKKLEDQRVAWETEKIDLDERLKAKE